MKFYCKNAITNLILFVILSTFQSVNGQWMYPKESKVTKDVIINYEIIYDKPLTEAQKKEASFSDNIVVIFNTTKMKYNKIYPNRPNHSYFKVLDYKSKLVYQVNDISRLAITHPFSSPKTATNSVANATKTILGYTCKKATTTHQGKTKTLFFTKALGLRYCSHFNVDGFLLEYPGFSKKFGSYRVVAKTIHYKKLEPSFYNLDSYKTYTKEAYNTLKQERREQRIKKNLAHIGQPAKKFSLNSINGKRLTTKKMLGEVIVLNFWFTTCPPCKKELPLLNKLKETYKNNPNVNFIALANDPEYKLAPFLRQHKFDYDIIAEARFVAEKYGVSSYPTNIVVDKEGVIQAFETGYKSDIFERLKYQIDKVLDSQK